MKLSRILKLMLAAAFPLYAIEDEAAAAAPISTETAVADPAVTPVADAAATDTDATVDAATDLPPATDAASSTDAPAVTTIADAAPEASDAEDASQDPAVDASADVTASEAVNSAPVVQTPTPVAQSGSAGDPVLETVKTPAHNVADEIQEQIKKLEELPAEVAAWFESKFVELAAHIKALL